LAGGFRKMIFPANWSGAVAWRCMEGIGAPTSETSGRIKARVIPWYLLGIKAIEEVAGDTRTV